MTTKEQVFQLLQESGSAFLSGQQIAEHLFLTRAAVWKAVKGLQQEGYKIEAVTNKGYRLIADSTRPDLCRIRTEANLPDSISLLYYDTVSSTNDIAKCMAAEQPGKDAVILAGSQSAGRGRRGRSFFSPANTGMYLSLLLHPQLHFEDAVRLTCLTAEALCLAIEEVTGLAPSIKWVNDLFYNGRKIAGILTESEAALEDGSLSYVVIGAGLNLCAPYEGFPEELKAIAGPLLTHVQEEDLQTRLYAAILRHFFALYKDPALRSFIDGYRAHSMLIGRYVRILSGGSRASNRRYARVKGIDDRCRLEICYDDGTSDVLSSGEVSVVRY